MFKINMPDKVSAIIKTLNQNGYEAYAVGGCVRDCLLGSEPKDWDITTNALPWDIKRIFLKTVDTGIEHGTVTVLMDKEGFEVTTYRIDGEYEDGRHPKNVEYTSVLKQDLLRRDFTINAMAYNDEVGLVDEFEGQKDLKAGIIRCVGSATNRFDEDALRILRAIRFSARLGFDIDEETKEAIKLKSPSLSKISAERIKAELDKTIISSHPEKLLFAAENGVFDNVLLRLGRDLKQDKGKKAIDSIRRLKDSDFLNAVELSDKEYLAVCWTILIYDYSREEAKEHFKNLRSDNELLRLSVALIGSRDYELSRDEYSIRRLVSLVGEGVVRSFFALRYALSEEGGMAKECYELYLKEQKAGHCMQLKTLAVTGKDLIEAKLVQGKKLGETLERLLQWVLLHPEDNNKEKLISLALSFNDKDC